MSNCFRAVVETGVWSSKKSAKSWFWHLEFLDYVFRNASSKRRKKSRILELCPRWKGAPERHAVSIWVPLASAPRFPVLPWCCGT